MFCQQNRRIQLSDKTDGRFDGGRPDIIGRGLIVHHGADDLSSQPAGNSGPRAACGVIEPAS